MTSQDIAEVTQLLDAVEKADSRKPLNDHLLIDLHHGGRAGFAGLTVYKPDTKHPIAYCQVSRGNDSWALDLVINPQHRGETRELGQGLLTEAIRIISNQGGGQLQWWLFEPNETHRFLASQINLKPLRDILQLRVELPLSKKVIADTKSISITPFQVGKDDNDWLAVNNRAFALHPAQGGWTHETLLTRQAEPWFDAQGLLLHHIDEQLVGFCWTKLDRGSDSLLGEIYVIAVDPNHHKKGLGRSLTVAGLNHLTSKGATIGMLYVDKNNFAAIAMYSKIGFSTHHQEQAFVGEISPSTMQS